MVLIDKCSWNTFASVLFHFPFRIGSLSALSAPSLVALIVPEAEKQIHIIIIKVRQRPEYLWLYFMYVHAYVYVRETYVAHQIAPVAGNTLTFQTLRVCVCVCTVSLYEWGTIALRQANS